MDKTSKFTTKCHILKQQFEFQEKSRNLFIFFNYRQKLSLENTVPLQQVYYDKDFYKMTSIKYEYEKIVTATKNPSALQETGTVTSNI